MSPQAQGISNPKPQAPRPTRRSGRTINKFCHGLKLEKYTAEQTCLLLTLCQISGWSADHVAIALEKVTSIRHSAELIWHFHLAWTIKRGGVSKITTEEEAIMNLALLDANIVLQQNGTPLSIRSKPTTITFKTKFCCSAHDDGGALMAGWSTKERNASKALLQTITSTNAAVRPTPSEQQVFTAFGNPLETILKYVLKRWHKAMKFKLHDANDKHSLKPIKQTEQIELIMTYLKLYQHEYEACFGTMEDQEHPPTDETPTTVRIRSTGFAAKVFLGIIMADRLWAINQRRKALRESSGFLPVQVEDLDDESKHCSICCDELGVANPEGEVEKPIRLVMCCYQVFGESCLKTWLKENWKTFDRDTCPNCRYKFPESFLEKLLGEDRKEKKERSDEDDDEDEADQGSQSDEDEDRDRETSGGSSEGTASSSENTPVAEEASLVAAQSAIVETVIEEAPVVESPIDEEDTPMGNTQIEIAELFEISVPSTQLVEVIVPSVEQEDEIMVEE